MRERERVTYYPYFDIQIPEIIGNDVFKMPQMMGIIFHIDITNN
jgi:hypothetical protein